MARRIIVACVLCCVVALVGCGPATFDTSSEDAFAASAERLPVEDRERATAAMIRVVAARYAANPDTATDAWKEFDGLTVDEVVAMGDAVELSPFMEATTQTATGAVVKAAERAQRESHGE